ncbi:MAG: ABC transporter permease subunit, partial [Planctomycetota bacterium]
RSQNTIQIDEPMPGVDAQGNPIQIQVWQRGTPKPDDPATRRVTVRKGIIGGEYSDRSWYYFRLPFGQSFLAAGLTLALVILPIVIISSQEALRAVPPSLREASAGLGATVWQTTRNVTLPAALPGILTGVILALGRAIGEAAPILVVLGATVAKDSGPRHLMDTVVTMPVLIFNWAGRQQVEFQQLSAAAIIILLVVLLLLNSVAVYLRHKMQHN